jgi:hypothetical protein
MNAMMAANPNLKITSRHRTVQQQSYLYNAKSGKGVLRWVIQSTSKAKRPTLAPARSSGGWLRTPTGNPENTTFKSVQAYLPANYEAYVENRENWTLEDYVIPRDLPRASVVMLSWR